MKRALFPLLLIVLPGCSLFAVDAAHSEQEDDIREAVFRYQFDHNASGQQKRAQFYYLAVGKKQADPTDEFMKRFADHHPPVRKVSEWKPKGRPGLVFRVSSIKWISDTKVEAEGGYYEGLLSSSGNTYIVVKRQGKWKVVHDRLDIISRVHRADFPHALDARVGHPS